MITLLVGFLGYKAYGFKGLFGSLFTLYCIIIIGAILV